MSDILLIMVTTKVTLKIKLGTSPHFGLCRGEASGERVGGKFYPRTRA